MVADWDMVRSFAQDSFVREVTRRYAYHVVTDQLQGENFQVVTENRQGEAVSLTLRRM